MNPNDQQDMREGARTPPPRIQGWIGESTVASERFHAFRARGGIIKAEPDIGSPSYQFGEAAKLPVILVDSDQWNAAAATDAPDYMPAHMFGALIHEIGHDRYNTTAIPFAGTTPDQYVDHRAGIEARAMFGAFEVARDLEGRGDFDREAFFKGVGYLRGPEVSALYADWRAGRSTETAVVDAMAGKVAEAPYNRAEPLQDQDGDGRRTHRDAYLRDYERFEAPSRAPSQPAPTPPTPNDPAHPDHALHDRLKACVARLDAQAGKPWDHTSDRLCASVFMLARQKAFTASDTLHVAFNEPTPTLASGSLVHVYRTGAGISPDPYANRAHMRVDDALAVPAQERYQHAQGRAVAAVSTEPAQQQPGDAVRMVRGPQGAA